MRILAAGLLCASAFAAAPTHLDLIGQVTGAGRRPVRVTLFAIDEPYTAATETDFLGEFRFHSLAPRELHGLGVEERPGRDPPYGGGQPQPGG